MGPLESPAFFMVRSCTLPFAFCRIFDVALRCFARFAPQLNYFRLNGCANDGKFVQYTCVQVLSLHRCNIFIALSAMSYKYEKLT